MGRDKRPTEINPARWAPPSPALPTREVGSGTHPCWTCSHLHPGRTQSPAPGTGGQEDARSQGAPGPFPSLHHRTGKPGSSWLCDEPAGKRPHSDHVWVALGAKGGASGPSSDSSAPSPAPARPPSGAEHASPTPVEIPTSARALLPILGMKEPRPPKETKLAGQSGALSPGPVHSTILHPSLPGPPSQHPGDHPSCRCVN